MHSRGQSIRDLGNGLAGIDVAVVQTKGEQLLKAGIDLLVHRGVLGCDLAEILQQTRATLVVVALGVLQTLAMLCSGGFEGTGLGMNGASALHGRGRSGIRDASSSLAAGSVLLLGWWSDAGRRSLGGAVALRGSVVVDSPHVVVQVPSTRESKSNDGSITSFKEAQMGVISVAVESVGLTLMTEKTGVRGETQLGNHAIWDLAAVGLQVGVQVFAVIG